MGGMNFTPAVGDMILKKGQWQTLFTWGGFNPFGILIINRAELKDRACECYRVIRHAIKEFTSSKS